MSTQANDLLLERAGELISLAAKLGEEFTGTTAGAILDRQVKALGDSIDSDNLDDLFNIHMPALENTIAECNNILAAEAQEHIYGTGDYSDVY